MPSRPNASARVWLAFAFLFLLLAASAAGIYFVSDLSDLQDPDAARESRNALQGVNDAGQIEAALGAHPANPVLQTIAMASRAESETSASIGALSDEIEPPALGKNNDLAAASRSQLESLSRDLKTAQANAKSFMPRCLALLKAERDKVEGYARLHSGRVLAAKLLETIDKRHAETAAFLTRILSARADYYRAYDDVVGFLILQWGTYKAVNGRLIFPSPSTAERFNAAAGAMGAAAKRVIELQEEQNRLSTSQQEQWLKFARSF